MFSLADVADGCPLDLDLDESGTPTTAYVVVDLDSPAPAAQRETARRRLREAQPIVIGRSTQPAPMLDACDVKVSTEADQVLLAERVAGKPRVAVALVHLLRISSALDVHSGLAAEAAAYSMLLSGPDFRSWLDARGPARTPEPSHVEVRRDGDRLDVVLDRPSRRNAMDASMREQLVEALLLGLADPDLSVTLSGAGPAFCAGGDLDEFGTATDLVAAYFVRLERHPGWLVHQLGSRVVARLHGACIGAGIEIPAFAQHVIAAPDTVIGLPELDLGLVPGAGGTVSVTRRIGRWRTAWLALSGEQIDAPTALAWGLVDAIE